MLYLSQNDLQGGPCELSSLRECANGHQVYSTPLLWQHPPPDSNTFRYGLLLHPDRRRLQVVLPPGARVRRGGAADPPVQPVAVGLRHRPHDPPERLRGQQRGSRLVGPPSPGHGGGPRLPGTDLFAVQLPLRADSHRALSRHPRDLRGRSSHLSVLFTHYGELYLPLRRRLLYPVRRDRRHPAGSGREFQDPHRCPLWGRAGGSRPHLYRR